MKIHPILFSGEMVRALLDGRKTVTRRVINAPPFDPSDNMEVELATGSIKPRWNVGDALYGREKIECANGEAVGYPADERWLPNTPWVWQRKMLPSIHMPRALSRLTLEVISVSYGRLLDISEEDAAKEGMRREKIGNRVRWCGRSTERPTLLTAREAFLDHTWTDINGESDSTSVAANPWVWRIEFTVHNQNVDCFLTERAGDPA